MTTVYDVPASDLITCAAQKLKEDTKIEPPVWADNVKTGVHKQMPPVDADWWFVRCAAVLRHVYVNGPVGVSRLRSKYGGKKRNGTMPASFRKGSGSIIRRALQQLESVGYAQTVKGGRAVTPDGQRFLDNVAYETTQQTSEA